MPMPAFVNIAWFGRKFLRTTKIRPNGTIYNSEMAAPEDDATGGTQNTMCFVTQNGEVGGSVGEDDVDGGSTTLISPLLNVAGTDGIVSYARWFYDSQDSDYLKTYVAIISSLKN
mgnify:CR=1 FL=1